MRKLAMVDDNRPSMGGLTPTGMRDEDERHVYTGGGVKDGTCDRGFDQKTAEGKTSYLVHTS